MVKQKQKEEKDGYLTLVTKKETTAELVQWWEKVLCDSMEEPEYQCYTADMVLPDNIISLLLDCLEHCFVVDDLEPLLHEFSYASVF
jgi:hypothetical protein